MKLSIALALPLLLSSCAVLHHAQLGDIDNTPASVRKTPIDLKVSEFGFSAREATGAAKLFMNKGQQKTADQAQAIWQLFHMGPSTGDPVFSDTYADDIAQKLLLQCPSGNFSGLTMIRESAKYPIISGEIVKIIGYCIQP